jgi:folate-binding protein YgfZ
MLAMTEGTSGRAELEREYNDVVAHAGLFDMSDRGRLQLSGKDALEWLNSLITNDVKALRPGMGMRAVLTTPKGRVIDDLVVLLSPDLFLVGTDATTRAKVRDWFARYIIREDVQVNDVTDGTAELWLRGPSVARVIEALGGPDPESLPAWGHCRVAVGSAAVMFVKTVDALGLGFNFILRAEDLAAVRAEILSAGAPVGLHAARPATYEALRLEAGLPAVAKELSEEVNPLEAGLWSSVSFKKGCYVGQEVVARLNTYHKVTRQLAGFVLEDGAPAGATGRVLADGKEIGRVTSSGWSPKLRRPIALGFLKSTHAEPGRQVVIEASEQALSAQVSALPFGEPARA